MAILKLLLLIFLLALPGGKLPVADGGGEAAEVTNSVSVYRMMYDKIGLAGHVSYHAFEQAVRGYSRITDRTKNVIALIDFSKPSTEERLFVIDMDTHRILHRSHVAHGRNSGDNYATSFSNRPGSHQSSLGFFLTGDTYQGRNGYSMLLHGLEQGINDKARERAVVVHPSAYANPSVAKSAGRLGRSFGCPALPQALSKDIIDTIKGGAVMFIYANDSEYAANSRYINPVQLTQN